MEIADSWNVRAEYTYLPYDDNDIDGNVHGFFVGANLAF